MQAQELHSSATLQVDFRHVESIDPELAGLIQQHHYRIELGLRQVVFPEDQIALMWPACVCSQSEARL